jgi:hypothetical protein
VRNTEIYDLTIEYRCPKCKRTLIHFSPYTVTNFEGLLGRLCTEYSRCMCGKKYKITRASFKERAYK